MSIGRGALTDTATSRVVLVQEIDPEKQAGFLIYLPVYRGGRTPPTVEGRRAALLGFLYSPVRAGDLLTELLGDPGTGMRFEIYDGRQIAPEHLLYRSPADTHGSPRFTRRRSDSVRRLVCVRSTTFFSSSTRTIM